MSAFADELGGRLEMHPAAAPAPGESVQADRLHPIVGRLQHGVDATAGEVLLRLGDVDLDQLARQRTRDEHDPPVVGSPHGVAAGDESVGPNGQLHPTSVWPRRGRWRDRWAQRWQSGPMSSEQWYFDLEPQGGGAGLPSGARATTCSARIRPVPTPRTGRPRSRQRNEAWDEDDDEDEDTDEGRRRTPASRLPGR